MHDLKQRTVRGGAARVGAQAANFVLRLGSLMILARLLSPKDFGLVGMVTAVTGVLSLFRDFGLSAATVQRPEVTEEQMSTLFWINLLVGALLGVIGVAGAPAIAAFYHEPKLVSIGAALSLGFVFNAAGVQHSALLQRQLRFTALSVINVIALVISSAAAIGVARAGYGYWSLVAMSVVLPLASSAGFWLTAQWIPGRPRRGIGIRSMMRFGGGLTLNSLLAYASYNTEKVLLGRYWGAAAIGIYGRAYQLINIPTENLNSSVGEVAFSALSRIQNEPLRLKSYFLKGYALVLGLTLPITIACALFADDLILVLLGPKWKDAAKIFRLLAPTIAIFAVINPIGWLLYSLGMVGRSLKIATACAPIMVAGYILGMPYGPSGVALAYSAVMSAMVLPFIAWCVHGTVITFRDVLVTVSRPLASALLAGLVAFWLGTSFLGGFAAWARLGVEGTVLLLLYSVLLLFVTGQKSLYLDLLKTSRSPSTVSASS